MKDFVFHVGHIYNLAGAILCHQIKQFGAAWYTRKGRDVRAKTTEDALPTHQIYDLKKLKFSGHYFFLIYKMKMTIVPPLHRTIIGNKLESVSVAQEIH